MALCFTRNKHVAVTPLGDDRFRVSNRLVDTYCTAEVEIEVSVPDLEVLSAKSCLSHAFNEDCRNAASLAEKAVGLRVGSGLGKALDGLIGASRGCRIMADLLFEACDAVVLAFTAQQMAIADSLDEEDREQGLLQMVQMNPRLLNSCIAFDENGPLLKGRK